MLHISPCQVRAAMDKQSRVQHMTETKGQSDGEETALQINCGLSNWKIKQIEKTGSQEEEKNMIVNISDLCV